jgi:hypothetical protein
MEPILISILSGLVAGATAKAKDVASTAVSDAYNGLKSLLIHKLGNSGAVQSVEDDSDSESASAALAEALANKGLAKDAELAALTESMKQALAEAKAAAVLGAAGIDIEALRARINVRRGRFSMSFIP